MMMIYDDGDHHHDSPPPFSSVLNCSWCCNQVAPRKKKKSIIIIILTTIIIITIVTFIFIFIFWFNSSFPPPEYSQLQRYPPRSCLLLLTPWKYLTSALIHLGVNMNTPHTPISFTQTPTTVITCSHSSPGGSGTRRTNTSCLGRASWPSWPPSSPPSPPDCSPPSSGGQEEVCASCPRSYRPIVCYNAPPLSSFTSSTSSADFGSW